MSTLQFCGLDFESQPFCVAGKALMRRVEFGADGSEVVTWRNVDGTPAAPAPSAADIAAATPGACTAAAVPPTKTEAVIKRSEATTAAPVAAGAYSVSILNVGSKPGVVEGTPLYPGESSNWEAWFDEATREMRMLPEITMDASGTVFHIQRVA